MCGSESNISTSQHWGPFCRWHALQCRFLVMNCYVTTNGMDSKKLAVLDVQTSITSNSFLGFKISPDKVYSQKRTSSFLDIFPGISPSSLEYSQIPKPQSFWDSHWPQQHQYLFVVMLGRRNNYVELDSIKKCLHLTPYWSPQAIQVMRF